jgi:NAD(P)-dependent dehydrogenase (short-subunit alcohol dehydrogenase family)
MSNFLGYRGKRVVITGCFSGMGEAAAKILLDLGAEVHGLDYKDSTLPLASFSNVDLRDPASIEAGVAKLGNGKVDALFHCAGLPGGLFPPMDLMKVNVLGMRHLTELIIPLMQGKGAVASISSTAGMGWSQRIPTHMELIMTQGFAAGEAWCEAHADEVAEGYAFSKETMNVWTMFMGARMIKQGIRFNATMPSPTQTPMMQAFHDTAGKATVDAAAEPLGRYTTPEEQAGPLVLLNSDAAGVVNGVVLPVDGGFMGGVVTGQVDMSVMMRGAAQEG